MTLPESASASQSADMSDSSSSVKKVNKSSPTSQARPRSTLQYCQYRGEYGWWSSARPASGPLGVPAPGQGIPYPAVRMVESSMVSLLGVTDPISGIPSIFIIIYYTNNNTTNQAKNVRIGTIICTYQFELWSYTNCWSPKACSCFSFSLVRTMYRAQTVVQFIFLFVFCFSGCRGCEFSLWILHLENFSSPKDQWY